MINIRQLIDFFFYGRHRLETIAMLPLGTTVMEAIELNGEPLESEPSEDSPEIMQHTFAASKYHEVVASEWKGTIRSIAYWSERSDPNRDLEWMFKAYRGTSEWQVLEEGYWYQRQDGVIKLWCSVIPAIGVAFIDYFSIKAELKKAHSVTKLGALADVTWAPDDAVFELQRMYVSEGNNALNEFAARSDAIVVSPDGCSVFIIRDHHVGNVSNGFMEAYSPPEPETGHATQVINCFSWSPDSTSRVKIILPRDARVNQICFAGDNCRLEIHQTSSGRTLAFEASPSNIQRIGQRIFIVGPYTDENLWKVLEDAEAEHRVSD